MRVFKRLLQVVAFLLTLIVGTAAAVLIVTQTAWFKNWLRGYIVREANQYLNGEVTIERLGGNLFFGVELQNIGVAMDGAEVISVKDIGLDYSVFDFITRGMTIDDIRLNKPTLYLRRKHGEWSIARLIKKQDAEADRQGPAAPIEIADIGITDGTIVTEEPVGTSGVKVPQRLDRLDAKLSFRYEPVHYSLQISHVSFRGSEPAFNLNALSGGIAVRDDALYVERLSLRTEETSLAVDGVVRDYLTSPRLNLQVSSDKTSLAELARLLPVLEGVQLQPAFELKADGPLDQLGVDVNVRSSAGQLTGRFVADISTPDQSVAGEFSVRHLDLAPILRDASRKTDLTADARVDLRAPAFSDLESLRGSVSVRSPRVVAMGYAAERVRAALRLRGTSVDVQASAAAYGADATVSGRVGIPIGGAPLTYDLHGQARRINLTRLPQHLQLPQTETDINAEYHVQGAEPPSGKAAGRGRQVAADLRFDGTRVAGAAVVAGSTAHISLDRDDITFKTDLSVAELNLQQVGNDFNVAALKGPNYEGQLGGHVSAEGQVAGVSSGITLDNISASVSASLLPSRIGSLALDEARVDADYRARSLEIRELDVVARDLNVKARGTVALDEAGQSNLTFHLDTPHLDEVGKLANVDIGGIASVEGTLTGNFTELQAKGRLSGSGVNYGEHGALTVTSDFDARIPDLTVERANVTADTHATFVTIAGQNINDLTARTTYADRQVQFDATAKQSERSVAAAGAAAFHPDHQEVHLERLMLQTQGHQWQLAPGSQAAVQYRNETVEVSDLRLVNGDQQIAAEGTIGQAGSALNFTLTNIDLAGVDAVLMRPPQFSGRLNASGRVEGKLDEPQLRAEFGVRDGSFRDFKYQALDGTVGYAGPELTLDARLEQNDTQWLTAKGTLPLALFSQPENSEEAATEKSASSPPIDLTLDSSPIGLGIVQGFTTAVTDVAGTFEAHVHVTGTADDPRPSGALAIHGGAVTVVPTGVAYRNIEGRIDLQPDRLHIEEMTVLDNHDSALSVTGDLAIRERQLGGVQLYVTAKDFKVIDNKMGNVRVESSLEINGELRAPRIGGYFGVSTGQLNLDEIIAQIGPSPYSTSQTEFVTAAAEERDLAAPSVFDGLGMDVSLYVPNDLVVRSSNLETPGSPIGLGALNVTFGGDLRAVKEPVGRLQLSGIVTTVRGTYDFQGRRFEILRDGGIRFDGGEELNPRLDIRTRRIIQAVEAFVNIRGTLRQPEIVLTSNPPLEQADILSLVVFNQPINQLGAGEQISLAARAQALAAGAVVNQLTQSIGGALHLDTFEIELPPDTDSDAILTIGQQIGRGVYVRVQQALGDQGMTNFILEYEINRWLRLQTNVLQGSTTQQAVFRRMPDTGVDLLYFFSY